MRTLFSRRRFEFEEIEYGVNPNLGCGLAAGYGPSRIARRPQYDWFFAGDGMVDLPVMLAAGQYTRGREELEFILKYQDQKTGMIWHELSQSAGWIDWNRYPYMFVHVELTFDFLSAVEQYFSVTGDRDFLVAHWPAIQSACLANVRRACQLNRPHCRSSRSLRGQPKSARIDTSKILGRRTEFLD